LIVRAVLDPQVTLRIGTCTHILACMKQHEFASPGLGFVLFFVPVPVIMFSMKCDCAGPNRSLSRPAHGYPGIDPCPCLYKESSQVKSSQVKPVCPEVAP